MDQQFLSIGVLDNKNVTLRFFPADPIGAASCTTLVAVVNIMMEIRTKCCQLLDSFNFFDFFAEFNPQLRLYDPKIVYDEYEDRFVIVLLQLTNPEGNSAESDRRGPAKAEASSVQSKIYLAVSTSGSPKGREDWYLQTIDSLEVSATSNEKYWVDYPGRC